MSERRDVTIFLNNAATSFPKSARARRAFIEALDACPSDIRGNVSGAPRLEVLRRNVARRLGVSSACVFFLSEATLALNCVIMGWRQDHPLGVILFDNRSHNAVSRPAFVADAQPFELYDPFDSIQREALDALPSGDLLVCLTWASNVSGAIYDAAELAADIKRRRPAARILLDASQAVGCGRLRVPEAVDFTVFPGHKFLYASPGAAVLVACAPLRSWVHGGTGDTHVAEGGPFVEVGTPNLPAITSLAEGLAEADDLGNAGFAPALEYRSHLRQKLARVTALEEIPVRGSVTSVISYVTSSVKPAELGAVLGQQGICVRAGLHCNPTHHQAIGAQRHGTLRFSPGRYNTLADILEAAEAVADIVTVLEKLT